MIKSTEDSSWEAILKQIMTTGEQAITNTIMKTVSGNK